MVASSLACVAVGGESLKVDDPACAELEIAGGNARCCLGDRDGCFASIRLLEELVPAVRVVASQTFVSGILGFLAQAGSAP